MYFSEAFFCWDVFAVEIKIQSFSFRSNKLKNMVELIIRNKWYFLHFLNPIPTPHSRDVVGNILKKLFFKTFSQLNKLTWTESTFFSKHNFALRIKDFLFHDSFKSKFWNDRIIWMAPLLRF